MKRPISLGSRTVWNANFYLSKIDGFHVAGILDFASPLGLYPLHHIIFGCVAIFKDLHPIFNEESPE